MFEKAFAWWLKQGDNKEYDVVKTGFCEYGRRGFIDVWWEHNGLAGRDRVYKRGNGYELIEIYQ